MRKVGVEEECSGGDDAMIQFVNAENKRRKVSMQESHPLNGNALLIVSLVQR